MSVLNKITKEFKRELKKTLWRKIKCEPDIDFHEVIYFPELTRRHFIDGFYIARSAIYYQFSKKIFESGQEIIFTMWIGFCNFDSIERRRAWLDVNSDDNDYLVTYYSNVERSFRCEDHQQEEAYGPALMQEINGGVAFCPCIEFTLPRVPSLNYSPELNNQIRRENEIRRIIFNQTYQRTINQLQYDINLINELNQETPTQLLALKLFKSDTCVLCLDENKKPNVLFCSCGHLCICENCDKSYAKGVCPVCRVKSEIKRKL